MELHQEGSSAAACHNHCCVRGGDTGSYTNQLFQTADKVASPGWLSTRHTRPSRRNDEEVRHDIGNGDGTVDDHSEQDINDQDKETKGLEAEGDSKDWCREQGCVGT